MCSCGKASKWKVVYPNGTKSEPMARAAALTLKAQNPGAQVVKAG